jgi:hypothetical protein
MSREKLIGRSAGGGRDAPGAGGTSAAKKPPTMQPTKTANLFRIILIAALSEVDA